MYLKKLHIKNFRCIKDLEVEFHPGLNILIGENDTGKTTILDALRLCFELGTEGREFYLHSDDFYIDKSGEKAEEMEFRITFDDLTDKECGIFIEMLTMENDHPTLELHIRFKCSPEGRIRRDDVWGGENEGQSIPYQVLDLMYFTHLDALRDARRGLAPSRVNQLGKLFMRLVSNIEEQKKYANEIDRRIQEQPKTEDEEERPNWQTLLENGEEKIKKHLEKVTFRKEQPEVIIKFVATEFRKIVEGLKIHTKLSNNFKLFEIRQNGLGFNNQLYTATVLGDLLEKKSRSPNAYVALLIEEPEAHLHPQLQNVFFEYLQEIKGEKIQVFVTSHSPTITAKTDIDSVIVLTKTEDGIKHLPLLKVDIDEDEKRKLSRFLDVTKSQLFFAKGVILVEGISEALLLPSFARITSRKYKEDYDLEKAGIEVVNIGGIAFKPFAKLFNSEKKEDRLNIRCAIITDDDVDPITKQAKNNRAENTRKLEGGSLRISFAQYTFEYQLYLNNPEIVQDVYREMHPRLKFDDEENEAYEFVQKTKDYQDKALFAQILAEKIETENLEFAVPEYIEEAIRWVIDGNGNNSN